MGSSQENDPLNAKKLISIVFQYIFLKVLNIILVIATVIVSVKVIIKYLI